MQKCILVLDIGGTNTRLAMMGVESSKKFIVLEKRDHKTESVQDIVPYINDFLKDCYTKNSNLVTNSCCISVAGAVVNNKCPRCVNVPFGIDDDSIRKNTALKNVLVINDFLAIGYGVDVIDVTDEKQIVQVPHTDKSCKSPLHAGTIAIVGAGTGLGVGFLTYDNGRYTPHPSEGGHAHFAVFNDEDIKILNYLKDRGSMVRFEQILSGQGIKNIFDTLSNDEKYSVHLIEVHHMKTTKDIDKETNVDKAAEIAMAIKENPTCEKTMNIFMSLYGRFAQSVALMFLATGGVFIAGGIASKNKELLLDGAFMDSFEFNDAQGKILKEIPVYLTLDYDISLYGCANAANRLFVN
ncbi:MAG: glucokinase [Candidatus Woesearchaeota archaeon]|jgi:glucokinase